MSNWTEDEIQTIWEKGAIVSGNDKDIWRKDQCGAWICRALYGKRDNMYGWEIDHKKPVSKGGADTLSNARPLQWANNAGRSDGRLKKVVISKGVDNVYVEDDAA